MSVQLRSPAVTPPPAAGGDPAVVQVALPVPLRQSFDYRWPATVGTPAAQVGCRVRVPFGAGTRIGLVVGTVEPSVAADGLKTVETVLDAAPLLLDELWTTLHWLARYLHAPLGEVLFTALPTLLRQGEPLPDTASYGWQLSEAGHTALPAMRTGMPRSLAQCLQTTPLSEETIADMDGGRAALRALDKRGLVERCALDPATPAANSIATHTLNPAQSAAVAQISAARGFAPFLLDGVTGSGKTEVYLEAIANCLQRGQQALVLVPEIGLTPQMLDRFRQRLGVPVHALHSGLTDRERAHVWTAARRGQARVIVGTRSAVFVPLPDAGLIVVDEEHDGSYKQFDGIRYHARDVALVRARHLDVPIVLGSATPSLESLHNARSGRYTLLRLPQRAGTAQAPTVQVVDVRKRPLQAGLSPAAVAAIDSTLQSGGQVLVFKNRRGYAPVLLCHDCGWTAQCPRCDTPMTVHAHGKRLHCHHCDLRRPTPPACPDCGSLALQPQGNGTERLEEWLSERFADVPVLRIDRGSTQGRDALRKHFDTLGDAPGILVGTQMLAKGHDLANLALVVVVGIDEGLFSADFRSGEKLAQLLIQVAGRAGRAQRAGEVLLQTHHPDHPLLHTLLHGGYAAFADNELALREQAGFPPFAHLALLRAEAKHGQAATDFLAHAKALLAEQAVTVFGPVPAPMPRRAGWQRMQLLLSAPQRRDLQRALSAVMPALYAAPQGRRTRWSLDVDPVDLG